MNLKRCLLLLPLLLLFPRLHAADLVKNGKANAEIILAENPSPEAATAAKDLQKYIQEMTGVLLPTAQPGKKTFPVRICVGESEITRKADYRMTPFRNSGYEIRVKGDLVILNGPVFRHKKNILPGKLHPRAGLYTLAAGEEWVKMDNGIHHAVTAFLEELGVRFYAPGKEGTILPHKKDLTIRDMHKKVEAAFPERLWDLPSDSHLDPETIAWYQHLKNGSSLPSPLVFSLTEVMKEILPGNSSWAARDKNGKIIYSAEGLAVPKFLHKGFQKRCIEAIHKRFLQAPSRKELQILLPIFLRENCDFTEYKTFRKGRINYYNSHNDVLFFFYCAIAKEIEKKHPGKILFCSFHNDKLPPEECLKNIPENLVPVFMPRSGHSYKTFRALKKYSKKLEEYHKLAGKRKLPLKEWWNEYSNPGTPRQPYFSFHALQEFRKVQKEFLTGVLMIPSMEKEFSLAAGEFTFLNYYINSRLLWDPELNLDSLLEEYLRDMYGKAAEKMKFFYTFSREVSSRPNPRKLHLSRGQMSPKEPAIFLELLAGAKAEVPKESPYYARIEKLEKTFRELQKAFLKIEFSSPLIKGEIFPYDTPCTGDLRKYTSWHTFSFTGKKNSPSTKIAIAFTENRKKLFLAFQCFEKEISKRNIKEIPRDTPAIAGEDHLAIHLSSPENNGSRILLDLSGNILDGSYCPFSIEKLGSYLAWNGVENHVVRRKADRWEGEIKIDLAGFGKGPDHFPPWEIRVERFRNGKKLSKFHRTIKIAKTDASNYPVNSHYMKLVPLPECREESIYIIQRAKGKADISAPWESKTWKDVPIIRMNWAFEKIPQTKFRPETQAKLLYDDENLYILYQVHDQYVRGEIKEDQGMVCSDSCVELFLQPVKGGKYYNFECNCIGSLLLYECRFSGKNMFAEPMPSSALQKIKRFTTLPRDLKGEIREKITYRIGLQIPLSLITERNAGIKLPLKGQIWRGNMYKCADYSSHGVQLAWKKCATFHAPDDFGLFIFE